MTASRARTSIGRSMPKLNARAIAMGRGEFTVDMTAPGMLHTRVLRSPHAHARIVKLDVARARALPGVIAIVTGADVPFNQLGGSVRHRPLLAGDVVRCVGEPVAAVAALSEEIADAALALIEALYEPLPAVFDVKSAMAPGAPLVHADKAAHARLKALDPWFAPEPGNASHRIRINRGDVDSALRDSPKVYRKSFATQPISHVCLETHAAFAKLDRSGRLLVWCSTGKPFRLQTQICSVLGLNNAQVRVEAPDVGGDFGNKGEASIEAIVALLALRTGRPVKGVFSREEEFIGAGLRIASEIDAALGVSSEGRLLALDMSFRNDIGPYDGYGSMVTLWAAVCAAGPYDIPHVRIIGESVHTNNLRGASFRGFGNPQVSFARECLLDIAAKDLGLHPLDFRRQNGWKDGSVSATGQEIRSERYAIGLLETLDRLDDIRPFESSSLIWPMRRGVGYASAMHGSGYGCLVDADTSGAIVRLNSDGAFTLFTGCQDVGQGTTTALVQIVAETLGVQPARIALARQDTDTAPYDNGASASRQLYISGNAALRAAKALRERVLSLASDLLEIEVGKLSISDGVVQSAVPGESNRSATLGQLAFHAINVRGEQPTGVGTYSLQGALLDSNGKGDPIAAFLFVSQRAEVEVDMETGSVRVLSLASAHDVGTAINPQAVEGQIEGALVQGMGYALLEEVRQSAGRPLGPDLETYLVPMSADIPELIPIIVETNEPSGPLGAKGVGEAGLIPTAAAIANAIENATGVRITSLPITPEKVLESLRSMRSASSAQPIGLSGSDAILSAVSSKGGL